MKVSRWIPILSAAAMTAGAASADRIVSPSARPNFIVIFADDLGYGDLACYGSPTVATPRIDRMAREGVRFTHAYAAAPFCSPSRAALLTGRLPARCGLPYVLFPAEHHGLPTSEITIAGWLQRHGYATACVGKWHVGWSRPFRPLNHGFDMFYGTPYSNDSNEWPVGEPFMQVMGLEPFPLLDGDRIVEAPADQALLTRRYTERAVEFIRANRDRPFFLYLAHTMPHIPQYASPEFEGKSKGGLYGDSIEELDWSTGVILDALRDAGLDETTLVIFTSDNGAALVKNIANERFPGRMLGGSNGPLKLGKGTTWEGGVRVPFVARWPGVAAANREVSDPVSLMDLFPILTALAGAELPNDRAIDGRNLAPLLSGVGEWTPRPMFHYFGYQLQAVRDGPWKLFVEVDRRPEPRPVSLWFDHQPQVFARQHRLLSKPELYNLESDPGETRNIAADHPQTVARLTRLARDFDVALQADLRPMEFAPGPKPPDPQTLRAPETDLSAWHNRNPRD